MHWETFASYDTLSERAAELLLAAIQDDPRLVLGLPTGRTPIGMYARIVADCDSARRCFNGVITFNLDEYAGIPPEHPGSYCSFMRRHLFDHVDLDPARTYLPNGAAADLDRECHRYESEIVAAGGLGLTFLGLGQNGHIGFNEPGTPFSSRTRLVELTCSTRSANASQFRGGPVPTHAITIGIATILASRSLVLLAAGEGKRQAIERLESGEISECFPASALWLHDDVRILTARDAT
jgi:glucosamine-6-phosphate deaminase